MASTHAAAAGARVATLLLAIAMIAGVALRFAFLETSRRGWDEVAYVRYGVALSGGERLSDLARTYDAHPDSRRYPSPTRAGYLWLVVAAMKLGGPRLESVVGLSIVASLATLMLLAWIATRWFGPWPATIAAMFFATSPLDLAIARRAWQDGVVGLFALTLVAVYFAQCARPRSWRWTWAFLALGIGALLVKESGLLLVTLGTLGLAITRRESARDVRTPALVVLGAVVALAVAALTLAKACGGWSVVYDSWARAATSGVGDAYMQHYQHGTFLFYTVGLGLLQPLPFLLGAIGAIAVVMRARWMLAPFDRPGAREGLIALGWMVVLVGAAAAVYPQKNLRFLSVIYGPVYLLAAVLLCALFVQMRQKAEPASVRRGTVAVLALIVFASGMDVVRFHEYFITRRLPDLTTPWLLQKPGGSAARQPAPTPAPPAR